MTISLHTLASGQQALPQYSTNPKKPTRHKPGTNLKTPWERLKSSHLIVDRKTGDTFSLNREQLKEIDMVPGEWIPLAKAQPQEPTVEYLSPLKRFKLSALKIGPISEEHPMDLSISLDENDETGRFQVIF